MQKVQTNMIMADFNVPTAYQCTNRQTAFTDWHNKISRSPPLSQNLGAKGKKQLLRWLCTSHQLKWLHYCHLQMKLWEGNVLTGVCLFTEWGSHVPVTHGALELTVPTPQTWDLGTYPSSAPPPPDLGPGYLPLHLFCLLLTPGGYHGRPVQTCSLEDLPLFVPVLTPSGGHWNTYGWQLGGTHSIRMLSCFSLQHYWPLHFHWDHPLAGRYKVRRSLCKVLNID